MHIENKKARHDYHIEETLEAGMVLEGWEVKAIRKSQVHIKEARIRIHQGEMFVVGMTVTPLGTVAFLAPDPSRFRKILLSRREIDRWMGKVERAGFTIVPLDLHIHRGRIKMNIGLAKGKKQHDKREDLKQKDQDRERRQALKTAVRET